MKKYSLLILLSCTTSLAWARPAEDIARNLLEESIGKHKNFQATFTYQIQPDQEKVAEEKLTGRLTLQGHQYRLSIDGQEVVSDGTTIWNYLKEAKEVQITNCDPKEALHTPWLLLTNYHQEYTFESLNHHQKMNKKAYAVVTLRAKDPENNLQQVIIAIEWGTKHIKRLEVVDNNHTRHIFSVSKFGTDLALEETFFNFIPESYAGVEVIDLR